MSPFSLMLLRDFVEDHRHSMDLFANHYEKELRRTFFAEKKASLAAYTPYIPPLFRSAGGVGLRLARFLSYPKQAKILAQKSDSGLYHILDQGYAHLLKNLPAERSVCTVHDLMPLLRYRGRIAGIKAPRKPWLNLYSFSFLRGARHLLADSENTRQDLIKELDCDPKRVSVVSLGVDDRFKPLDPSKEAKARLSFNLPEDGSLRVLISGFDFYKNHTVALRVFAAASKKSDKKLELIRTTTAPQAWMDEAEKLGVAKNIRVLKDPGFDGMPLLYGLIDVLLFPSLYEGFGLPVLEAMASGVPVVCSNAASLPEIAGNAALQNDPRDEDGLTHSLISALFDHELRQRLTSDGLDQAAQFSWKNTAQKSMEIYKSLEA